MNTLAEILGLDEKVVVGALNRLKSIIAEDEKPIAEMEISKENPNTINIKVPKDASNEEIFNMIQKLREDHTPEDSMAATANRITSFVEEVHKLAEKYEVELKGKMSIKDAKGEYPIEGVLLGI